MQVLTNCFHGFFNVVVYHSIYPSGMGFYFILEKKFKNLIKTYFSPTYGNIKR